MLRERSWNGVLAGVGLVLVLLAGCSASAYRAPAELTDDTPSASGAAAQLAQVLEEVANGFGTKGAEHTELVDEDATTEVAVRQLDAALGFSDQVGATVAAWAQHWRNQVPVQQVEVAVDNAEVVGTWQGNPLAQVTVELTTSEVPEQEQSVTFDYGMSWRDGALQWIGPLHQDDGEALVDTGRGLASPTGAANRYLELVRQGNWAALERFSAGANSNRTALEVLGSVIDAAQEVRLVAMPTEHDGVRSVYAVTGVNHVIAQFSVDLESRTVLYRPTV